MKAHRIFQLVADHMITHGRSLDHSRRSGTRCCYRTPSGKPKGLGVLIKDAHYSPALESILVYKMRPDDKKTEPLFMALVKSGVNVNDPEIRGLLRSLQTIHDRFSPKDWPTRLSLLASSYYIHWETKKGKQHAHTQGDPAQVR